MKQEVLRMKKGHLDAFLIGQTATAVEAMQKIDFNAKGILDRKSVV